MNDMLPAAAVKNEQLFDFFIARLKELHTAEKHLIKTFPRYRNAAGTHELKTIFSLQLENARNHTAGLEAVSCLLGKKLLPKKNDAIESIVMEGERIAESLELNAEAMDTSLMLSSRKLIHYMIPAYNGLIRLSFVLGFGEISALLKKMLDEEKQADRFLNMIAEQEASITTTTFIYKPIESQKMYFPRLLPLRSAAAGNSLY